MSASSLTPDIAGTPDQVAAAVLNPDASSQPAPATQSDQAASTPSTATPSYPPSPDQPGGQNPITGTSDDAATLAQGAAKSPSLFRSIVMGALSGVANHLKGAGEGLVTGGIPGALVGAVNPKMADNALKVREAVQTSRVQQAQAQARSAMQDVQFAKDNHDVQMAQAQIHLAMLNRQFNQLPEDFQAHLQQEGAEAGQHLIDSGVRPVWTGSNEDDANAQVQARMQVDSDNPMGVVKLPDGAGGFNVFEIPNNNKLIEHPVDVTIGFDADGTPITKTYPTHTLTVGQRFAIESAAMVDQAKLHLQKSKNQGAAKVAEIKANASAAANATKNMQLFEGTDATGNQAAGTPDELKAVGINQFVKMPAAIQGQTLAARELTSPDGLFAQARKQVLALNQAGKLGPIASRVNNFIAGRGMDGDQLAFLDTLKLISTKLMQAHVGSRGSKDMLEHFESLVPPSSTPATLMSALNDEYQYVNSVAKRPKKAGQ